MVNTISFDVNNKRKLKLVQRQHDGSVLIIVEDAKGGHESISDNEALISPGDFVMLIDYFRHIKSHGYRHDFINPNGTNAEPQNGGTNMEFTHYTLMQDGKFVGSSAILHQAAIAAMRLAAEAGKPVTIMAHIKGGGTRKAIFNPDGTNEHIWDIDKGQPLTPTVGQVYVNRGGGRYLCRALETEYGIAYFNPGGGCSSTTAMFRNVKSGWTFTAKGVVQYVDGTIEWDHSVDGRFEDAPQGGEDEP